MANATMSAVVSLGPAFATVVSGWLANGDEDESTGMKMLCPDCKGTINQTIVCKACGTTDIARASTLRGSQSGDGRMAVFTQAEADALSGKGGDTICDIEAFVPEIDPRSILKSYFLAPDVKKLKTGAVPFAILRDGLDGRFGVGTMTLRKKKRPFAITKEGRGLMLHALRYTQYMRKIDDVAGGKLSVVPERANPEHLKLLNQLIDVMPRTFDFASVVNEKETAVLEAVQRRLANPDQAIEVSVSDPVCQVVDFAAALEAMIAAKKAA